MKVSREQMAQNRGRILTEAGRLFREKGFDSVSVAEVMKAAGMTHGGFYGHFKSKDDLIAHAITHAVGSQSAADSASVWMDAYLSTRHRDNPGRGCPTAALAGFMREQGAAARDSMAQAVAAQIDTFADAMPGADAAQRRLAAIGNWSAMVGALILARSIDDPVLSEELLTKTRAWIEEKASQTPKPSVRKRRTCAVKGMAGGVGGC